jgi:hypothetical protein
MMTNSPSDEKLITRGLLVPPVVAGVLGSLLTLLVFPPSGLAIVFGVLFAITGTVITICAAYPLLLWFVRRGQVTLPVVLVSGAVLGNIPAAIAALAVIFGGRSTHLVAADLWNVMRPMAVGTVVGFLSAASFWVVSGRHLGAIRH